MTDRLVLPAIFIVVIGILLASIGGPLWAFFRWKGGWRVAAAVPLVVMAATIGRIAIDVSLDPTSHNLWPFECLMVGALCTTAIVIMAVAKKVLARRGANG